MPPNLQAYEAAIRELIADMKALRERGSLDESDQRFAGEIERKLGALLPPISARFNVNLAELFK